MSNPFFQNFGPFKISELLSSINLKSRNINLNEDVIDIKDLSSSNKGNITFYHSKKYKFIANKTNASFCITTEILKNDLPDNCTPIVVENVLVAISKLTAKFYPDAIHDTFDNSVTNIKETEFKNNVKFYFTFT